MRAWTSEAPEENIQRAKEAVEDMRAVMHSRDDREEVLGPIIAMIKEVEETPMATKA